MRLRSDSAEHNTLSRIWWRICRPDQTRTRYAGIPAGAGYAAWQVRDQSPDTFLVEAAVVTTITDRGCR